MNLFGFTENNGINRYDINGRVSPAIVIAAVYTAWSYVCFKYATTKAKELFKKDDQRHCYGACAFTKCSLNPPLAYIGGLVWEYLGGWDPIDSPKDIENNLRGIVGAYSFNSCFYACVCPTGFDEDGGGGGY